MPLKIIGTLTYKKKCLLTAPTTIQLGAVVRIEDYGKRIRPKSTVTEKRLDLLKKLILWNNELTLQSFGGAFFGRSKTMTRFRPEDLAR